MHKEIKNYLSRGIYPFHMPGHKRNKKFFPQNFFEYDLTEFSGMDNLHDPNGIIKKFCEKISKKFFSFESFFLTNGASAGIVAAICATCDENTILFAPRNAHVSLYNGLIFSGARPKYFFPEIFDGFFANVSPEIFDEMPHGAVAVVVSPTYEGFVSDIAAIAKKVHARDGILIVDEAHGAHFAFHDYFPETALQQGADIVINSLHKTLPAVSGCAAVHTRKNFPRLRFFLNAMQTTSPSYMLIANCDFMFDKLTHNLFEKYISRLEIFRKEFFCENKTTSENIRHAPNVIAGLTRNPLFCGNEEIPRQARNDGKGVFGVCRMNEKNFDRGKILFSFDSNAKKICETAEREFKIQFEMSTERHILAMTSVADTAEGFSRLEKAARFFSDFQKSENVAAEKFEKNFCDACEKNKKNFRAPQIIFSPREAMRFESEKIPAAHAIGRISAELIAQYPPGIAQIVPGELIETKISKPFVRVLVDTAQKIL